MSASRNYNKGANLSQRTSSLSEGLNFSRDQWLGGSMGKPMQRENPDARSTKLPPDAAPIPTDEASFNSVDSELVIGLVGPTGADLKHVASLIETFLLHPFNYRVENIKITSELLANPVLSKFVKEYDINDYNAKINSLMDAGNDLRLQSGRPDFLALLAISAINSPRERIIYENRADRSEIVQEAQYEPRTAYIIHQLKHPNEVRTFRKIYGPGFYLIGVHTSYAKRLQSLLRRGVPRKEAINTLTRDMEEEDEMGQHTRDTFALADAFVTTERLPEDLEHDVMRMLRIIFADPFETPTRDEYCMFLAYAASLRSADLSRQVGAVLVSGNGDITATGSNEVAKSGGGQYWAGEQPCCRDYERGEDSNEIERQRIISQLKSKITKAFGKSTIEKKTLVHLLRNSKLWEITEYGRSIHAEMEAILSCARAGISTRDGVLYTTTFPCHNCAKHIVDAGVKRVVFVEPYPKSRAPDLLSDSIEIIGEAPTEKRKRNNCSEPPKGKKVQFEPFIGVGARRFVDLFSMHLTTGEPRRRKSGGKPVPYVPGLDIDLKIPLMPNSYLQRERTAGFYFESILDRLGPG